MPSENTRSRCASPTAISAGRPRRRRTARRPPWRRRETSGDAEAGDAAATRSATLPSQPLAAHAKSTTRRAARRSVSSRSVRRRRSWRRARGTRARRGACWRPIRTPFARRTFCFFVNGILRSVAKRRPRKGILARPRWNSASTPPASRASTSPQPPPSRTRPDRYRATVTATVVGGEALRCPARSRILRRRSPGHLVRVPGGVFLVKNPRPPSRAAQQVHVALLRDVRGVARGVPKRRRIRTRTPRAGRPAAHGTRERAAASWCTGWRTSPPRGSTFDEHCARVGRARDHDASGDGARRTPRGNARAPECEARHARARTRSESPPQGVRVEVGGRRHEDGRAEDARHRTSVAQKRDVERGGAPVERSRAPPRSPSSRGAEGAPRAGARRRVDRPPSRPPRSPFEAPISGTTTVREPLRRHPVRRRVLQPCWASRTVTVGAVLRAQAAAITATGASAQPLAAGVLFRSPARCPWRSKARPRVVRASARRAPKATNSSIMDGVASARRLRKPTRAATIGARARGTLLGGAIPVQRRA